MKLKLLFLTGVCSLAVLFASAADNGPGNGNPSGKKDDINGNVIASETKKPLNNVSITAYLTSKKEKVVITDGNGNYAFDDLKPGTYKFIFEKEGFKRVTREKVVVRTDEAFQLNIEMIEAEDHVIMPSPFHFN